MTKPKDETQTRRRATHSTEDTTARAGNGATKRRRAAARADEEEVSARPATKGTVRSIASVSKKPRGAKATETPRKAVAVRKTDTKKVVASRVRVVAGPVSAKARPSSPSPAKPVSVPEPAVERRARPRTTKPAAIERTPDRRKTPRATGDRRRSPAKTARAVAPAVTETVEAAASASASWATVGAQERVSAVKYGARPAPRAFDEERFLFPRNYEINRVRVVVRDPEWLFAYWDVNPRAFESIRRELGERVMSLSRLTLQVQNADGAAVQVILLPYGARSWYVRIDPSQTRYFIELGVTLPSGQFRSLARSNVVAVPRGGPSSQPAVRSLSFRDAWAATGEIETGVGVDDDGPAAASVWLDPGTSIRAQSDRRGASDTFSAEMRDRHAADSRRTEPRGGASDLYRR